MQGHHIPHTEETKQKIRAIRKLQGNPWNIGKKRPDVSARMKIQMKGKKFSQEHKDKIGLKSLGCKLSDEAKHKISIANKGEKSGLWKGGKHKVRGLDTYCNDCRHKKTREYYYNNTTKMKSQSVEWKRMQRERINELKNSLSCLKCR